MSAQAEVPEMRWSRVILSWRVDDMGFRVCDVDPLLRHGPKRREILVYLLQRGGEASTGDLAARFAPENARVRNFVSRDLGPMREDGILKLDGRTVKLADSWCDELRRARLLVQEPEDHSRQCVSYEIKKAAYRNRDMVVPDRAPTQEEMDASRQERERREQEDRERPVSDLAAAIRLYLERNPHDAAQPVGWLGITVWAEGLHPDKLEDPPRQARVALEELGGEEYLRGVMSEAA